jgi:hypothetical protein
MCHGGGTVGAGDEVTSILRAMATEPVSLGGDLATVVARARRQAAEAGELLPADAAAYEAEVEDDVREFLLSILRDGSYAAAVAELTRHDPDLATQ